MFRFLTSDVSVIKIIKTGNLIMIHFLRLTLLLPCLCFFLFVFFRRVQSEDEQRGSRTPDLGQSHPSPGGVSASESGGRRQRAARSGYAEAGPQGHLLQQ